MPGRLRRNAKELVLSLLMAKIPARVPLLLATNNQPDLFNCLLSATSLAHKSPANTKPQLGVSNSSKSTAIIIFSILDILHRHTVRRIRYNGGPPQPKYEH